MHTQSERERVGVVGAVWVRGGGGGGGEEVYVHIDLCVRMFVSAADQAMF